MLLASLIHELACRISFFITSIFFLFLLSFTLDLLYYTPNLPYHVVIFTILLRFLKLNLHRS
jgi:hypothetical protein